MTDGTVQGERVALVADARQAVQEEIEALAGSYNAHHPTLRALLLARAALAALDATPGQTPPNEG
jgi:uncharacterized membrane protein